jgi:hypothetical protein
MKRLSAIVTSLMVLVLLVTACGGEAPVAAPIDAVSAPPVSTSGGEDTTTDAPAPTPPVASTAPTDTPLPPTDTVDQPDAGESGEPQATLLYFWASW